jgi:hypothetical protein
MKMFLKKILLVPIIGLMFSGCYTTLWMPDGEYDESDYAQSNQDENYYQINDYGDYYYYYNRPWWYSSIQVSQDASTKKDKASSLRNNDNGRGSEFKRSGRSVSEVPSAPLPTVSAPAAAPSAATSTSNNSTDNSGNRVESSSSSGNNKNSNNNNPVRNNDGNRNTSGR